MERKIYQYIRKWKRQGYPDDIPDLVPDEILKLNIAPSYKIICMAILRNDHSMKLLGFDGKRSEWYDAYKKIELKNRGVIIDDQQMFLF